MNKIINLCFLVIPFLCACTGITPIVSLEHANKLATASNWERLSLPTQSFVLTAYVPAAISLDDNLAIYIEGDGQAWTTISQPSADPTSMTPVALKLALQHPHGNAAYLARPCQFTAKDDFHHCRRSDWTSHRFSPDVVKASSQAIDALKARFGAQRLTLIGYSGGGAVAALVAAQRDDVSKLITVAGNLDHVLWTQQHKVTPLKGSLNPADQWSKLVDIPQLHFVGSEDKIVSEEIVNSFRNRFPRGKRPPVKIISGFDHGCCWQQDWLQLVNMWAVK